VHVLLVLELPAELAHEVAAVPHCAAGSQRAPRERSRHDSQKMWTMVAVIVANEVPYESAKDVGM
jgi:hypothetical protein